MEEVLLWLRGGHTLGHVLFWQVIVEGVQGGNHKVRMILLTETQPVSYSVQMPCAMGMLKDGAGIETGNGNRNSLRNHTTPQRKPKIERMFETKVQATKCGAKTFIPTVSLHHPCWERADT